MGLHCYAFKIFTSVIYILRKKFVCTLSNYILMFLFFVFPFVSPPPSLVISEIENSKEEKFRHATLSWYRVLQPLIKHEFQKMQQDINASTQFYDLQLLNEPSLFFSLFSSPSSLCFTRNDTFKKKKKIKSRFFVN